MSKTPHFGFAHGLAVHKHAIDHMPSDTRYQRFNKACAIWITKNVGSMTAFWLFTLCSALVAPSCLYAAGYIHWKSFITTFGFELLATLILSTWLELVLMPAIMVGQNIASAAADARAAKTFEDTEKVVDALDLRTQGGLQAVMHRLDLVADQVNEVHRHVTALAPQAGEFEPSAEVLPEDKPAPKPRAAAARKQPGGGM